MKRSWNLFTLIALLIVCVAGCGGANSNTESASSTTPDGKTAKAGTSSPTLMNRITGTQPIVIPAGTVLTVRLGESLSSATSQSGQTFSATLAEPLEINNKVVIARGANASGKVVDAKSLGHFKGGARLELRLESISVHGQDVAVSTSVVDRAIKGKGKRSAVMIGGGAGLGALIGGLAGGGKGAAIGAGAGAGAGTAGAAFTGNKNIVLPAETALSFRLLSSVEVKP